LPIPFWRGRRYDSSTAGAARQLGGFGRNYSALTIGGRNGTGSIATVTGGVRKLHVKSYGCQMNVYDSIV